MIHGTKSKPGSRPLSQLNGSNAYRPAWETVATPPPTVLRMLLPEGAGHAAELMTVVADITGGRTGQSRGTAVGAFLRDAIVNNITFGKDDYRTIRRSFSGQEAQYFGDPEAHHLLAIKSGNQSAARSIERYFGRSPWWHSDVRLCPSKTRGKRRRLYFGAELFVMWEGEERRARLTAFLGETVRLKIGPDAGRLPDAGFKWVIWDRETLKNNTPEKN